MPILDLVTILCLGLMTGNELAVSLFVNPALWELDASPQAQALSLLARSLGKVMPFWYAICFVLLIAEIYARRHSAHIGLLYVAAIIWAFAILYSVMSLVPINNQIARLNSGSSASEWQSAHRRWDALHRWRILMLVVALACFIWSIVSGPSLSW